MASRWMKLRMLLNVFVVSGILGTLAAEHALAEPTPSPTPPAVKPTSRRPEQKKRGPVKEKAKPLPGKKNPQAKFPESVVPSPPSGPTPPRAMPGYTLTPSQTATRFV